MTPPPFSTDDLEPLDRVLRALAHPVRRRILDLVSAEPGINVGNLAAHFEISRIGVMNHLRTLEDVELLVSEKEGRERRFYFNAVPIQRIYDRWTAKLKMEWASELTRLKAAVESKRDEN